MAMLPGITGANEIPEQTGGGAIPKLPAGGYVCRILNVGVDSTQNGSTFIKLQIDIQEGEYAAHFTKLWNASKNSQYERKWKGVYKIFLPVNHGDAEKYKKAIAFYKGQVNSITRSNGMPELNIEAGYDPDVFKGKLVGVLFREAEYAIDGKSGTFTEPAFLTDAAKIRSGDFQIPEMRRLQPQANHPFAAVAPQTTGGVWVAAQASQQSNPFSMPATPQTATQPVQQANFTAQQPQQAFQNFPQSAVSPTQPMQQPAPQPSNPAAMLGDLSDFEEILSDGDVPF